MSLRRELRFARQSLRLAADTVQVIGRTKIFCIGRNKTGTTSLAEALRSLGIVVGNQAWAERLAQDWGTRDFRRLFLYCQTAQAFQDMPFSWPFTFQALDQRFPRSKFILTVRNSADEWYGSLTRFLAAMFGHGRAPTLEDLRTADYIRPGAAYAYNRMLYDTPADDPYNKAVLTASYETHNRAVIEYFRHRPGDLLVLNVSEPEAYPKLCAFLGRPAVSGAFPWKNKTDTVVQQLEGQQGEPKRRMT